MTRDQITEIQGRYEMPAAWKPRTEPSSTLFGRTFKAVLRGRLDIRVSDRAPQEIVILTEAGPIYIDRQIIWVTIQPMPCDGSAL